MTFEFLSKLIADNNIPEDVNLQSDSGWECSETEMDGIWYNRFTNTIIFTQRGDEYDRYMESIGWELIYSKNGDSFNRLMKLKSAKERSELVKHIEHIKHEYYRARRRGVKSMADVLTSLSYDGLVGLPEEAKQYLIEWSEKREEE